MPDLEVLQHICVPTPDLELLLQLCLPVLRRDLAATVECSSELRMNDDGHIYPVAGTMDVIALQDARNLASLIREVEGAVGTPSPSSGPDWINDVIDGRGDWKYLVEENG